MSKSRTLTLSQEWFLDRSKKLIDIPSKTEESHDGACGGIAYTALIMYFSGDIDLQKFNEYMEWIHDTPEMEVPIIIENTKNKLAISADSKHIPNNESTDENKISSVILTDVETENDRMLKLINIYIFFLSIYLLQNPQNHAEVFPLLDKAISQECELDIISLLLPEKLEKLGGISKVTTFSGCYNKQELLEYFKSFRDAVKQQKNPLMLILQIVMHGIAVGYNPEKDEWIWVDANRLLAKKFHTLEEITEAVLLSFFDPNKAIFSTKIYTLKQNEILLKDDVEKWMQTDIWQNLHAVTPEKAKITDILGDTWLSLAAKVGCLETVIELLKQPEINPNSIGKFSCSPILLAAEENHKEIVKVISRHKKTDINLPDRSRGFTPLNVVSYFGYFDIAKFLLAIPEIDFNKPSKLGAPPLMMAVQCHCLELVVLLLEKNEIDVNQSDFMGGTSLYVAAQHGNLDILKALLNHPKIDVNASLKNGYSPLHAASHGNHPQIVEELMRVPCIKLNTTDTEFNQTPLCMATDKRHLSVVNELLKDPTLDVNCFDCYGYTPLHSAIEYGFEDIVLALLRHPMIDINLCKKSGESALGIARRKNHIDIEKLLINYQGHGFSYNNCKAIMYSPSITPSIDRKVRLAQTSLHL